MKLFDYYISLFNNQLITKQALVRYLTELRVQAVEEIGVIDATITKYEEDKP